MKYSLAPESSTTKCGDARLLLKLIFQKWPKVNNAMTSEIGNFILCVSFTYVQIHALLYLQIQRSLQACHLHGAALEVSVSRFKSH